MNDEREHSLMNCDNYTQHHQRIYQSIDQNRPIDTQSNTSGLSNPRRSTVSEMHLYQLEESQLLQRDKHERKKLKRQFQKELRNLIEYELTKQRVQRNEQDVKRGRLFHQEHKKSQLNLDNVTVQMAQQRSNDQISKKMTVAVNESTGQKKITPTLIKRSTVPKLDLEEQPQQSQNTLVQKPILKKAPSKANITSQKAKYHILNNIRDHKSKELLERHQQKLEKAQQLQKLRSDMVKARLLMLKEFNQQKNQVMNMLSQLKKERCSVDEIYKYASDMLEERQDSGRSKSVMDNYNRDLHTSSSIKFDREMDEQQSQIPHTTSQPDEVQEYSISDSRFDQGGSINKSVMLPSIKQLPPTKLTLQNPRSSMQVNRPPRPTQKPPPMTQQDLYIPIIHKPLVHSRNSMISHNYYSEHYDSQDITRQTRMNQQSLSNSVDNIKPPRYTQSSTQHIQIYNEEEPVQLSRVASTRIGISMKKEQMLQVIKDRQREEMIQAYREEESKEMMRIQTMKDPSNIGIRYELEQTFRVDRAQAKERIEQMAQKHQEQMRYLEQYQSNSAMKRQSSMQRYVSRSNLAMINSRQYI